MTEVKERHGDRVRRDILAMGLQLWCANVEPSARRIASEMGMTHSNILHHFGHSAGLHNALAFYAVKAGESRIIAKLILAHHSSIAHLTEAERMQHMKQAS